MIYTGFLLLGVFLNLLLGLFVLSREGKDKTKKTFCYWTISMAIWNFMDFGLSLFTNPQSALKWAQIMIIGVFFIPSTFYHFVVSFLKEGGRRRYYLIPIGYIISLTFIPTSLSGFLVSGVTPLKREGFFPLFAKTPFPFLFLLFFYGFTVAGVFLLVRRYIRTRSPMEKNQLKYVLIGLLIAGAGAIFNFLLAFKIRGVFPMGNIAELAFVGLTAYSIVKYHLMDINLVIRPGIIYGTLTGLIIATWLFSIFVFEQLFHIDSSGVRLLGLFVAIFVFSVLKDRVQYLVDRLFYRERQELAQATSKIAKDITSTVDPDIIATSTMDEIYKTCHPEFVSLLMLSRDMKFYEIKALMGEGEKEVFIPINDPLIGWLKRERRGIFREEKEGYLSKPKLRIVVEGMEKRKTRFTIPLFFQDELIGLLNLGDKRIGYYTYPEIDFLETVGKELSIALANTKLYSELKEKKEELEKALQAKTDFLHIVSHELNTPLSVIIGEIHVMERELKKKKIDLSSMTDLIKKKGEQLSLIIKDMMDVASLEKGEKKYEPKKEEIDVERLISEAVSSFKLMALNKGLIIRAEVGEEISFTSDKNVLENILFRLLDNAIKFTPSGGEILVGAEKKEDGVLFFVKDTGIGIREEDREKIFERFSQLDQSSIRKYGGLGLGLSIAKDMVLALEGKIWVEGEINKGSKFCFTLPSLK
ncbi:MAG: ATP-binding protein [bacterium]